MWPTPHLTPPNNMTLKDARPSDGQRREGDALWQLTEHITITFNVKAAASQPYRQIHTICVSNKCTYMWNIKIDMNRVVCFTVWVAFNHALRGPPKDMQSKVKNISKRRYDKLNCRLWPHLLFPYYNASQSFSAGNNHQMDALCLWGESI